MEFKEFPKIPRLFRDIVISEKIDGTNAQVFIRDCMDGQVTTREPIAKVEHAGNLYYVYAGSRSRWIEPGKDKDNYGFASWVVAHAQEFVIGLGEGQHFGEWFGAGIQSGYGLKEKKFALFNVGRWNKENKPACCEVVPVLYEGPFSTQAIEEQLTRLRTFGSCMVPGYMKPEGIIVFHKASGALYKATIDNDGVPKGLNSV